MHVNVFRHTEIRPVRHFPEGGWTVVSIIDDSSYSIAPHLSRVKIWSKMQRVIL